MQGFSKLVAGALCTALSAGVSAAGTDDGDALALESAPESAVKAASSPLRVFAEASAGRISQRYGLPTVDARRVSFDLNGSAGFSRRWRWVLSDRLDDIHPVDAGGRSTLNSLREAYIGWQDEGGRDFVEVGRINVRLGPAYGYNPTDYFRDGALRAVTTADPFALRENRLGTVMLRWQRLWPDGGVSLAVVPKLANSPSDASLDLDLGATNSRHKALASWSTKLSGRLSGQLLAFAEQGKGPQFGASLTALLSEAAVAHAEWSRGRDDDLFSSTTAGVLQQVNRNRLATGVTYTTSTRLALTAEYEYNGFAPDQKAWDSAASAGTNVLGGYLLSAQARQDNASRQAWLLYASQKSAFWKNLDLTGFLRLNAEDHSRLGWLELRYHWNRFDGALQWQRTSGGALSEYGLMPLRQSVQLLGAWYF